MQEPVVGAVGQGVKLDVQHGRKARVPGIRDQVAERAGFRAVGDPAVSGREREPVQEESGAFQQETRVGQGLHGKNAVHVAGPHRADLVMHNNL